MTRQRDPRDNPAGAEPFAEPAAEPFSSRISRYQSRSLSPPLLFQSETACCTSLIFLRPRTMSSSSCSKSLERLV